jgi:serine/threonine protein kinase
MPQPIRFGKYLLMDKIAIGDLTQIYLAKIMSVQGFEKLTAIKMILLHLAQEKELVTSFADEAKLAVLLQHRNIVQIYDLGTIQGSYFISMEYLFGKDLKSVWQEANEREKPVSLENALYITSLVCSGLSYAHKLQDFQGKNLNIIHRNIKPHKIFVTYQGNVKILDFGTAKAASQNPINQRRPTEDKVAYLSPEQAAGKTIDQRSDIFSTGILLYELVTGNRMFTGEDTTEILTKVQKCKYEPPESIATNLPPKIIAILGKALAINPDNRYQSCSDMHADLEECLIDLSLQPTARGLAVNMKDLFHEDIAKEVKIVRKLRGSVKTEGAEKPTTETPVAPEASATTTEKDEENSSHIPEAPVRAEIPDLEQASYAEAYKMVSEVPHQEQISNAGTHETVFEEADTISQPVTQEPSTEETGGKKRRSLTGIIIGIALLICAALGYALWMTHSNTTTATPENIVNEPVGPAGSADQASVVAGPPASPQDIAVARALYDKAVPLAGSNPEKAASLLEQAIKLDPNNIQAQLKLGRLQVQLEKYSEAIETYEKIVNIDSNSPDVYFNLAFAYAMNKDYSHAETLYRKVVNLAPKYLDEALFNLAMMEEKQGKLDDAVGHLKEAQTINPENKVIKEKLQKLLNEGKKK